MVSAQKVVTQNLNRSFVGLFPQPKQDLACYIRVFIYPYEFIKFALEDQVYNAQHFDEGFVTLWKYRGAKSQYPYVGLNSSVNECPIEIILSGMTYYHHWFKEFVKRKHIRVHFFIYLIVWIVGSFGHSNYVCPEEFRVVGSRMTEIRSITSLFMTCDQVIGLPNHVLRWHR